MKVNESERIDRIEKYMETDWDQIGKLEARVIALERALEGVLRRLEESGQAEDEAGWFGRPE